MSMTYNKISSVLCGIAMVCMLIAPLALVPASARAEGLDVPTNQQFDIKAILGNLKSFSLDWLATTLAKQILHQMTLSIINWINSGFKGSPAFLTNPAGFFVDVGDQVTGEFLSTRGALSRLCSPFSLDIRLALALDQTVSASQRYTCTLGKIVDNARGTIEGFTGGDFSQGGWPAFMSLSLETQNNMYGSYLQAHSDLLTLINSKKNTINQDLDRGHGFLSWEQCKDVSPDEVFETTDFLGADASNLDAAYTQKKGRLDTGNGTSYTSKVDANGNLQYQDCHTETPGSVIAGSLQKSIDSPIVEGELADDINGILNALVSQMISQMLSGGLAALSGGGSGSRTSYTRQVLDEIDAENARNTANNSAQLATTFDSAIESLNNYKSIVEQEVGLLTTSKNQYAAARACFVTKSTSDQYNVFTENRADHYVNQIDQIVSTKLQPLLNQYTIKLSSTTEQITRLTSLKNQSSASSTIQGYQFNAAREQIPIYQTAVTNSVSAQTTASKATTDAQAELKTVQQKAQIFSGNATQFSQACERFPTPSYIQTPNI